MSRLLVVAVAVVAGACSSKGNEMCAERTGAMAAALRAAIAQGGGNSVWVPGQIELVEREGGEPLPHAPSIAVAASGQVVLGGQTIRPAQLDRALAEWWRARQTHEQGSRAVLLVVDRRAPAASLIQIAARLPDELEPRLVLRSPAPRAAVPARLAGKKSVVALLADTAALESASDKAVLMAERLEHAVEFCAPLIRVFGELASGTPAEKARMMAEGAPRALNECHCKVKDLDLLEYVLLELSGAFAKPFASVPLVLADTGAPLPDAATAAELIDALLALPSQQRRGPFALPK